MSLTAKFEKRPRGGEIGARRNREAVRRVVGFPTTDSKLRQHASAAAAAAAAEPITAERQKHHENGVYRAARREYYVGAPHESRVEIVPSG